ncbi:MAG: hypothetical protein AABX11_05760 [Nanoarchaeota archaeon]
MAKELRLFHAPRVYSDGWEDPIYETRGISRLDVPQTMEGLIKIAQHQCMPTIVAGAQNYVREIKDYVEKCNTGPIKKFRRLVTGIERALAQLEKSESRKQARIKKIQDESSQRFHLLEEEAEARRNAPLWIDSTYGPVWPEVTTQY